MCWERDTPWGFPCWERPWGCPWWVCREGPAQPGCASSMSSLLGKGLLLPQRAPGQLGQGLEQPGPLEVSLPMKGGQNQITSMVPSNINHSSAHFGEVVGDWLLCRVHPVQGSDPQEPKGAVLFLRPFWEHSKGDTLPQSWAPSASCHCTPSENTPL